MAGLSAIGQDSAIGQSSTVEQEPLRQGIFPLHSLPPNPPGWPSTLLKGGLVFCACLLLAWVFDPTLLQGDQLGQVIFLASLATGGAIATDRHRAARQRQVADSGRVPPPLEILEDGFRWAPLTGLDERPIPFSLLRIAATFRNRGETVLALGIDGHRTVILPAALVGGRDIARRIVRILRYRIEEQPGGHRQLAPMARRAKVSERIFRPQVPITWTVVTVLCATYLIQLLADPMLNPVDLLAMGANSAPLVIERGQGWRLLTANLLHGGLLHLLLNAWALVILGRLLEPLLGRARFFNLLLLSSFAGALASTVITRPWASVGASTGISGLAGALAVLFWQRPEDFPTEPSRRLVILLVVMLFLPGLLLPNIDNAGHAGGLVAGALLTALFLEGRDWLQLRRRRQRLHTALGVGLALLFLLPAVGASARTIAASAEERAAQVDEALSVPGFPEVFLNNTAWELAVSPVATEAQLRRAAVRLESALGGPRRVDRARPAERDTLATLFYRLGDLDRAVELSASAAETTDDSFHRSQLARFDLARQRRDGSDIPPGLGTLPSLQPEGRHLVARLPEGLGSPALSLRAVVLDAADRPKLLVELELGPARGPQRWRGPTLDPSWEDVVITQVRPGEESAEGRDQWRITPVRDEVLGLP